MLLKGAAMRLLLPPVLGAGTTRHRAASPIIAEVAREFKKRSTALGRLPCV